MRGKTVNIQLQNGEVVKAKVVSVQGDNMTVKAEDGFVYEVDREANWQGVHNVH